MLQERCLRLASMQNPQERNHNQRPQPPRVHLAPFSAKAKNTCCKLDSSSGQYSPPSKTMKRTGICSYFFQIMADFSVSHPRAPKWVNSSKHLVYSHEQKFTFVCADTGLTTSASIWFIAMKRNFPQEMCMQAS